MYISQQKKARHARHLLPPSLEFPTLCEVPLRKESPTCDAIYDCSSMYGLCRLVQVFDPAFAAAHASPQWVDNLANGALADLPKMKAQLPTYLTRAQGFTPDISDVEAFSVSVLDWWRRNADDAI